MTAELYLHRLINGDLDKIIDDNRGKYYRESVFENVPDLKDHLFEYVVEKVSEKKSSLKLKSVVETAKTYMENNHHDLNESKHFHIYYSIQSVRSLLEQWGFFWSNNKMRPFFNGHERDDVVEYRKNFVDYFAENKNNYFISEKKDKNVYNWITKTEGSQRRIIIAHDESTIRSGDVTSFKWLHEKFSPMFNKGRGVSRMISEFIVAHPDLTCFELTEDEWNEAINENPELNNNEYVRKTATRIIEPTKDNYFTNETILHQFKHLISCLKYSQAFKSCNYRVDILVDNATTHTKASVDVSMFNKSINSHCGIDVER